jgi:hypothetical protein
MPVRGRVCAVGTPDVVGQEDEVAAILTRRLIVLQRRLQAHVVFGHTPDPATAGDAYYHQQRLLPRGHTQVSIPN